MSNQAQRNVGFMGRIHAGVNELSPSAAKVVKEIDIVGVSSKRRGLYKKHLLKGTRVWGGSFWQDFWINFCHPKHPLSGKERFIILTFELLLKMFVAGIFSAASDSSDDQSVVNMLQSIFVALFTTLFSAILVFVATCDDRFLGDSQGGILRCALSALSACGLCFAWFMMLMLGILGVVMVSTSENSNYGNFFTVTAQSLGWSWFVIWPTVNGFLLFAFGRWREQRKLAKEGKATADDIQRDTLLWWKTNEFPPDKEIIETETTPGGSKHVQATVIPGESQGNAEQLPGTHVVPSPLTAPVEIPEGQHSSAAAPVSSGASPTARVTAQPNIDGMV